MSTITLIFSFLHLQPQNLLNLIIEFIYHIIELLQIIIKQH